MNSISYKIKIRATVNGVDKIPTDIAWINGSDECLVRPCYKENDYIVVELIPDCVGSSCIEGYIHFDNSCINCEPLYFKRCFCSGDTDCDECSDCINGVCQSICPLDWFCKDDKCYECDQNTLCKDGKVCVDGKCVCPSGTFWSNQYNRCVECDNTTTLTKCQSCLNGHISYTDCIGDCDPTTGSCVDCLSNLTCGINTNGKTCCVNKQCVCCTGSVWNPSKNTCVPVCKDSDCGECKTCGENGCEPVKCPKGYKCVGGDCILWPCIDTFCDNGADCGDGCGCLGGQCVPCYLLECGTNCSTTLGCKCSSSNTCEGVDTCTTTSCDGFSPCLEPGCTCYNYNCVSCENFSCSGDECSKQTSCFCSGSDCKGIGDGGGGDNCNDTFTLSSDCNSGPNDCKLIAKLSSKPCICDPIKFNTTSSKNSNGDIIINVELLKGNEKYANYKTSKTIGNNELVSGEIGITITYTKLGSDTLTENIDKTISDNTVGSFTIPNKPGYEASVLVRSGGIKINNNKCNNYSDDIIGIFDQNDLTTGVSKTNITNDKKSERTPLFSWYENGTLIRKNFPTGSNGNYEDILNDSSLLKLGSSYTVKTECGCSTTASLSNLEFCCYKIDYTVEECNSRFKMPNAPSLCDVVEKQSKLTAELQTSEGSISLDLSGPINKKIEGKIESGEFYLKLPNGDKKCVKPITIGPDSATPPVPNAICTADPIKLSLKANTPDLITKVEYNSSSIATFNNSSGSTLVEGTIPRQSFVEKPLIATVTYKNGCKATVGFPSCQPELILDTDNGLQECGSDSVSSFIKGTIIGFDLTKSITWGLTSKVPVTTAAGINTYTFTDIRVDGSYTLTASQVGFDTQVKTANITVGKKIKVTLSTDKTNLCGVEKATIKVQTLPVTSGVAVSFKKNGTTFSTISTGTNGEASTQVSEAGNYSVSVPATTSTGLKICEDTNILEITKTVVTLNPSISIGSVCLNTPAEFTINNSGNEPYIITATGGTISTIAGKNYFTPTSLAAPYTIHLGLSNTSCNILPIENKNHTVTVLPAPLITAPSFGCQNNLGTISLIATGTLTSVKLLRSPGSPIPLTLSGNTWSNQNVPMGTYKLEAISPNNCTKIVENITFENCSTCPVVSGFSLNVEEVCVRNTTTARDIRVDLNTITSQSISNFGNIAWYDENNILIKQGPYSVTNLVNLYVIVNATSLYPKTIKAVITYTIGSETCTATSQLTVVAPVVATPITTGNICNPNLPCQCADGTCEENPTDGLYYCGCVENATCVLDLFATCKNGDVVVSTTGDCGTINCSCPPGTVCTQVGDTTIWVCSDDPEECGCGATRNGLGDCECNTGVCSGGFNACQTNTSGIGSPCTCIEY